MLLCNRFWMGLGKCDFEMGVKGTNRKALLLVGASGGIGGALLEYLLPRTDLVCIPTFNMNKPRDGSKFWTHFNSQDFNLAELVFKEIASKYEVSLVIDATGAFFASTLQKSTPDEINQVIATNLVGPMILAKSAQKLMAPGGKIVFMSSVVSAMTLVGSSAYAASKAGLERGILTLSPEFNFTGHAICGVRLGYMDYGMTYKIKEDTRNVILENMEKEEFINISVLGDLVLEIIATNAANVNGKLYEIT